MAVAAEHTIEILFEGVDNLSGKINKISGEISDFGSDMNKIGAATAPFADLAEKILLLEAATGAVGVAMLKSRGDIDNATKGIEASLDMSVEKAKELEPVFKNLFAEGFADSIEDAAESVKLAFQKFGDVGTDQLDAIATKGLNLQKIFGVELNDSFASAQTLMKNFGISSAEAFDFITVGLQQGLDGSGDFLESINEYSTQFANGGASAEQFFSLMSSGFQEGILGTDKAADAFKEFRVRIQDGSKATSESLQLLGIDASSLGEKMSKGTVTAAQAFELVIGKLNDTTDANTVMQAGVGLLGTQFEDLGTKAALNLSLTETKMDDLIGKSGELTNKIEQMNPFEKMFRALATGISEIPIFDKFYNEAVDVAQKVSELLPDVFNKLDYSELEKSIENLKKILIGLFDGADITTAEGLQKVLQNIIETFVSFQNTANGVIESFGPLVAVITELISSYNELDSETQETIGSIIGFGAQLSALSTGLGGVVEAYSNVASATESGAGKMMLWVAAATAAFKVGYKLGEMIRKIVPGVDDAAESFFEWSDELLNWTGTQDKSGKSVDEITNKLIAEAKAMQDARKAAEDTTESVKKLGETEVNVKVTADTKSVPEQIQALREDVARLENSKIELEASLNDATGPAKEAILKNIFDIEQKISEANGKEIELTAEIDTKNTEEFLKDPESFIEISPIEIGTKVETAEAKKDVQQLFVEVGGKTFVLETKLDDKSANKTKEELEKIVPPEKQLKILADIEIAQLQEETKKFQSVQETVQKGFEFKSKLDIAEVEANVQILEGSMENINTLFTESGAIISDAFGVLGSLDFGSAGDVAIFRLVKEQIKEQNELQREALELQKEITKSQIKLNEAKQKALLAGKPMFEISIDGSGLEYDLDRLMYSVLERTQAKATEEGLESLLGLS